MSYEYWIHQQLEPNDILIIGKQKRSSETSLQVKWKLEDEERLRIGNEEYEKRNRDFVEWERTNNMNF